jgi:hypothetical protein
MSPYLNRYLLRGVDTDVLAGRSDVMVYAKLCRVLLFGFIQVTRTAVWRGTKLQLRSGAVGGPVQYRAPRELFEYMNKRSDAHAAVLAGMSDTQKAKVDQALMANIDKLAQSDVLRAMQADVSHSGKEAFRSTRSLDPDELDAEV